MDLTDRENTAALFPDNALPAPCVEIFKSWSFALLQYALARLSGSQIFVLMFGISCIYDEGHSAIRQGAIVSRPGSFNSSLSLQGRDKVGVFSGGSQRCRLPAFHPHPSPLPQGRGRIKRPWSAGRDDCKVLRSPNVVSLSKHRRITATRPSTGSGPAVWVIGRLCKGQLSAGGVAGQVASYTSGAGVGHWIAW